MRIPCWIVLGFELHGQNRSHASAVHIAWSGRWPQLGIYNLNKTDRQNRCIVTTSWTRVI